MAIMIVRALLKPKPRCLFCVWLHVTKIPDFGFLHFLHTPKNRGYCIHIHEDIFLPVKIKFLAIQYSRYSNTYIFVVGSNCLSLDRVDILQWTRGEPNHEVKVRRRSSEEVEVVAHGNCRSAIHTLVQGTFQVRYLQYTCMHHCGKTMGWLPLRFGIGSRG